MSLEFLERCEGKKTIVSPQKECFCFLVFQHKQNLKYSLVYFHKSPIPQVTLPYCVINKKKGEKKFTSSSHLIQNWLPDDIEVEEANSCSIVKFFLKSDVVQSL